MSEARRYRVLGALGPARFAPLLAEQTGPGPVVRRVVLTRPAPDPDVARLGLLGDGRVVSDEARTRTPDDERAVVRFVPGADLELLRDAHDVPPEVAREIALQVGRALVVARSGLGGAPPVGHGALAGDKVRLRPDGVVVVTGFRGGDEADDVAALRDLLDDLGVSAPPGDLAALVRHLADAPRADLAAWIAAHPLPEPPLFPHPLTGAAWDDTPAAPGAPPKVRIARFGAATLVLGLAAGFVLARALPTSRELTVTDATRVEVACGELTLAGPGPTIPLPPHGGACEVRATFDDGVRQRGPLTLRGPGRYACDRGPDALSCG